MLDVYDFNLTELNYYFIMITTITKRSFSTVLKPDLCIVGAGPAGAALACCLA